jgi:hypothetical protein
MLLGADDVFYGLCDRLSLEPGSTTPGGRLTLDTAECLGGCDQAPCMLINDMLHGSLTVIEADDQVEKLRATRRCLGRASSALLERVQRRRPPAATTRIRITKERHRSVIIAEPGSEEMRMLDHFGANASVSGEEYTNIIFREAPRTVEVLEEFLHGTQYAMGLIDRQGITYAEIHVKRFMLRHKQWLKISDADALILRAMVEG